MIDFYHKVLILHNINKYNLEVTYPMQNYVSISIIILLIIYIICKLASNIKRQFQIIINRGELQILKYMIKTLKEGDINDELSRTPKSLSSMTSIYLPQIQKDFPEFNWNEFKPQIQNAIINRLNAIDSRNALLVSDLDIVYADVKNLLNQSFIPHYKEIRAYDTVISSYKKQDGTCMIVTETSIEYYFYIEDGNKILKGSKQRKKQTSYLAQLIYIQDPEKAGENVASTVCPNCGAPITTLGNKYCEYCGSSVEPINVKAWKISSIYEN